MNGVKRNKEILQETILICKTGCYSYRGEQKNPDKIDETTQAHIMNMQ